MCQFYILSIQKNLTAMKKLLVSSLAIISLFLFLSNLPVEESLFISNWNVENLFDTADDPLKDDNDFLPESEKVWDQLKYETKIKNLSKAIAAFNRENGPDILGLEEVENAEVVKDLAAELGEKEYGFVHMESPDNRGIDNALIYKSSRLKVIKYDGLKVELEDGYPTRLILWVKFLFNGNAELNVFVNHWPSRRGGQSESESGRIRAAKTLRTFIDNNLQKDDAIVIIGDFNDDPVNMSIVSALNAVRFDCDSLNTYTDGLYNLAYKKFKSGEGSYLYRGNWNMLDQIIVSDELLNGKYFEFHCDDFQILKPEFIITKDGKYKGASIPTFGGRTYLGGFSDHLPIGARFILK